MKTNLILVFFLTCLVSTAKDSAYYVDGSYSEVDLLLVDTKRSIIKKAFSFKESITEIDSPSGKSNLFTPKLSNQPLNDSLSAKLPSARNVNWYDSLKVAGKWYKIHFFYADDRWVGGRQNTVNHSIAVSDIGVIYTISSSYFFEGYHYFILNHKEKTKHKVLIEVYQFLKNYPVKYSSSPDYSERKWDLYGNFSKEYTFKNNVSELFKRWLDARESLKFVSCKSEIIDDQFNYTVTLKNISGVKCFIPKGLFGPSDVRLNKEVRIIDLDSLRYRPLFGHISSKTIGPGEEVTYTTVLHGGLTYYNIYTKLTCSGFNLKCRNTHIGRLFFWMSQQALKGEDVLFFPPAKIK